MRDHTEKASAERQHTGITRNVALSVERPRNAAHGTRPGQYMPAVRLHRSMIDAGEIIDVDAFITGYGTIEAAKLAFYPSTGVIDESQSTVRSNLESTAAKEGTLIWWGGADTPVRDIGIVVELSGGANIGTWRDWFFDIGSKPSSSLLMTEIVAKHAPVTMRLMTRKDARPGAYMLHFVLTYFNGDAWQQADDRVTFTIRNLLQRNETWAWWLAIAAAVISIVAGFADLL